MSYGFRCVVPLDCVWDRSEVSHAINLFDMAQKYADVMTLDELLPLLEGIPVLQTTSSERGATG
jgi:isochorismate hydrolase